MKLGQQVCFFRHWVKNQNDVDHFNENGDDAVDYKKLVPVDCDKTGIIVGKRNFGVVSHLVWYTPDSYGEDRWICHKTTTEPFYLVACNLSGFYKVKEADLWEVPE